MWQYRLGHSSFFNVNRVLKAHDLPVSNDDSTKNPFCDSCQLGKSKRLPFSASNRLSTKHLALIHTDVWKSPIPSISDCKYHIIFVDDFTRYTWLYPLHNKSDAYEIFVKFKTLVETQFCHKIQSLQSDGGGEFTSIQFQVFLSQNGITHRKSCPHTSQQNGLAERKLRHILETGLTLLAHSGLSNKYWVDAFLTFVYIINCLPTRTLNHISPYAKLYGKDPNYSILRVFGCKCFPLLRPYTANKLEYRSKACIFLGYSYGGYRCLDPFTDRVYLSRHVIFDEQSFPAKDHAQLQLPTKINAASDSFFTISVSHTLSPSSLISDSDIATTDHVIEPLPSTPPTLSSSPINDSIIPQHNDSLPSSEIAETKLATLPHIPTSLQSPHAFLSTESIQPLPLAPKSVQTSFFFGFSFLVHETINSDRSDFLICKGFCSLMGCC
jgi:hypothetical protein